MFFKLFKSEQPDKYRRKNSHAQDKRQRLEKIPVDELRIGMYVRELDKPWEDSEFMFQGLDVKTQQDILAVQRECEYVLVDYSEYRLSSTSTTQKPAFAPANNPTVAVEDEYSDAREVHNLAQQTVTRMFEEIRLGGQI
ncbi:MAG TPA: hypothetical protein DD979_02565, partial [Gammaproteobacteria bacterium]|nr:hypothetical protein [Gammaproteobacteria bacterium]